jgi:hypothetical protein
MYYKLLCNLYALLCGQKFILVKSGCYMQHPHYPGIGAVGARHEKKQVNRKDAIGTKAEFPPKTDLNKAKNVVVDRG